MTASVCFEYFLIVTVLIGRPLVLPIDFSTNLAFELSSCNLNAVTVVRRRVLDPRSQVMTVGQTRSSTVTVDDPAPPEQAPDCTAIEGAREHERPQVRCAHGSDDVRRSAHQPATRPARVGFACRRWVYAWCRPGFRWWPGPGATRRRGSC